MKIEYLNNKIIVYLKKEKMSNIDFENIEKLEEYFKKIFTNLKKIIEIEFNGFYDINIYIDLNYGSVMEIKRQELEYVDYYDNQIDMKITVHDVVNFYKINDVFDIPKNILNKIKIYKYKNNLYCRIIKQITPIELAKLIEMSEIIYKTEDILTYGKKLEQNI